MVVQDVSDMTSFKWGVIAGVSPLSVQLDGDVTPLELVPDSLVDPLGLAMGDRVRVELTQRRVVIHGRSNGVDSTMPGDVKITARSTAPEGWLVADGAAVSRTTYPRLFEAIGTTYGTGDGSTTFNLPNLKGRVVAGRDTGQTEFDTLGETGGAKTHTLTTGEMPSHGHYVAVSGTGTATVASYNALATRGINQTNVDEKYDLRALGATADSGLSSDTGGGAAHNNLQPYIVLNYIIKT